MAVYRTLAWMDLSDHTWLHAVAQYLDHVHCARVQSLVDARRCIR